MSLFHLKDKLDHNVISAFNIASDVAFFAQPSLRRTIGENKHFHNTHQDQDCFIFGTGPSLAQLSLEDILFLKSKTLIAVNSFYKAKILDELTPKYYCLLDNNFWGVASYTFREVFEKYSNTPPIFITDIRASHIVMNLGIRKLISIYSKHYPLKSIRTDISSNLSITMNVISTAILCAIYMGFKRIYLLGCDYNLFCSRIGTHCYDDTDEIEELPKYNLAFYLKYYHLTTEFHYLIRKYAKQNNIDIVNLTPESLLDAYPMNTIGNVRSSTHSPV
ncbi:MAG: hypothetical protein RIQ60_3344 [Pseudomonadota bacterium]|jgi:hypothetical protein